MAMQGKDIILLGALGGLGYVIYKWWENTQSNAPVSTQQTTNATGQTASVYVAGGGTPATVVQVPTCGADMISCITTPTGVVVRGPTVYRPRIPRTAPGTQPSFIGAFATGVKSTRGTSGLGSISPSLGFGIRRAANIFPTGIERRIIY